MTEKHEVACSKRADQAHGHFSCCSQRTECTMFTSELHCQLRQVVLAFTITTILVTLEPRPSRNYYPFNTLHIPYFLVSS